MNILIFGATGFIGNALFHALVSTHTVTIAGRKPIDGYNKWKQVDFLKSTNWDTVLEGMDLVINAVGIIEGDFAKIQLETPLALYKKCIEKEIKIIHISAIGAEKSKPQNDFLASKKVTDDFVLEYPHSKVIYPSIVIGKNGKSSQFFAEIAQFPLIPLFDNKKIPFIHINQLTELVYKIVEDFDEYPQQIFATAKPETLQSIFSALKGKKARSMFVPSIIFKILFVVFPFFKIGFFTKHTFGMFQSLSASDYEPIFEEASKQINPKNVLKSDVFPQLIALLSISFIWLWSGISSLISWEASYGFMQEVGANHQLSVLFIYLGSIADIILGLAIFSKKYRKKTILLQVLTMLIYMLILSIAAPYYWIHPFGVLSKNIPLFALSYYLYQKQN
jgi:uncharacterized protein YbjT (DUF2867 family)